jgi:26S proteasome regulatory subunit N10
MTVDSAQAIVFLIDNSESSINGDFYPNRLDAQKMSIERLMSHFSKMSLRTQLAIGTLSGNSFGICAPLTTDTMRLSKSLGRISRGSKCDLEHGIRCAFLSLHLRDQNITTRRIIAMVSCPTPLTRERADALGATAIREGVLLDIVAFGADADVDTLKYLTARAGPGSRLVFCPRGGGILSDAILSSEIGSGPIQERYLDLDLNLEDDPDLALTLQMSMEDQADDPELAEALRASMEEEGDDPELIRAMRELQEQQQKEQDKGNR